jgi:DNA modification methylase
MSGEATLFVGDALTWLEALEGESVQCCITSPPYYGLRDYGVAGQIGLEKTPQEYVARLVGVFREMRRVLKADGTLWVVIGDSYARDARPGYSGKQAYIYDAGGGRASATLHLMGERNHAPESGLKPKDLIGIPWMLAFALRADGWYLRNDIVWAKPGPLPESVQDRCTRSHEYIFLLAKSERYYYDAGAIAEPVQTDPRENYPARARITGRGDQPAAAARGNDQGRSGGFPPRVSKSGNKSRRHMSDRGGYVDGSGDMGSSIPWEGSTRNKRDVWWVGTRANPWTKGKHFATFPEALIEPMILAGSRSGDIVLDPFAGSGTSGAVALRLGRRFQGIELNPEYAAICRRRIPILEVL